MRYFFFTFIVASLLGLVSPVQAITTVTPVVEIDIDPGTTETAQIQLYNETAEPLALVGTIEAFSPTGEDGQIQPRPATSSDVVLEWITFTQDTIVIQPGQIVSVPFSVTVPDQTTPGGYYAVLFWGTQPTADGQLQITARIGSLVFIRVTGPVVEQLEVLEFLASRSLSFELPVTFTSRVSNTGNVHVKPVGELMVTNAFGQRSAVPVNSEAAAILPGSVRSFAISYGQQPAKDFITSWISRVHNEITLGAYGPLKATLSLTYGDGHQVVATTQLTVVPWRTAAVGAVLLVILFGIIRFRRAVKKIKNRVKSSAQ